jgi:hypothetical protein
MNSKQKLSLGFLILGLILSSIVRVRFNVSNGFEFQDFWITPIPSIFDFAAIRSSDLALTSSFFGYFFLAISGLLMLSDFKALRHKTAYLTVFLVLTLLALVFESVSIIQDISSSFAGQHLRIGLALFLFGLLILVKNIGQIRTNLKHRL